MFDDERLSWYSEKAFSGRIERKVSLTPRDQPLRQARGTHRDVRPTAAVLRRVVIAHTVAPADIELVGARVRRADPAFACARAGPKSSSGFTSNKGGEFSERTGLRTVVLESSPTPAGLGGCVEARVDALHAEDRLRQGAIRLAVGKAAEVRPILVRRDRLGCAAGALC